MLPFSVRLPIAFWNFHFHVHALGQNSSVSSFEFSEAFPTVILQNLDPSDVWKILKKILEL